MAKKQSVELLAIERQVYTILMKMGVTGPELDQCLEWAFGPYPWSIPPCDWPGRWNILHPNMFRIGQKDKFVEIITVIGDAYMRTKYGKDKPNPFGKEYKKDDKRAA